MSLKNYLDERGRKFTKRELTLPISVEGADARLVWNTLRGIFISKHEDGMREDGMCQEITIKLFVSNTGGTYYTEPGGLYSKLITKDIVFPKKVVKIILQLAKEDEITVICKKHQTVAIMEGTHLGFQGDKVVYEFTYMPPSK